MLEEFDWEAFVEAAKAQHRGGFSFSKGMVPHGVV